WMRLACGTSSTHAQYSPTRSRSRWAAMLMWSGEAGGLQPWVRANATAACSGPRAASPKTTLPLVTPSRCWGLRRHTRDWERGRSRLRFAPHTAPPTPLLVSQQATNRHRVVLHRNKLWAGRSHDNLGHEHSNAAA